MQLFRSILRSIPFVLSWFGMQAFAHYAAMSDLNVSAGGTSEFFRGALVGIAFGRGFYLCGSVSTVGGSTSPSGQKT